MTATLTTPRLFTVDQYYRMAEVGILDPGERVELIEGKVVRMEAMNSPHAACVNRLTRHLVLALEGSALVRVQTPLRLSEISEPEPDFAIVRFRSDDYAERHPGPSDTLLVIEVADTSVDYDREVKAFLYATSGVLEYWLVDLEAQAVEVYREPSEIGYREVSKQLRGGRLSPLAFPELRLDVDDVLP